MNWNMWVRQILRWLSIAFTVTVMFVLPYATKWRSSRTRT